MAAAELRDRRVIRRPHPRDHLERHVLPTRTLDPPRGPVPTRIRVEQKRHHHLRVVRRPARATQSVALIEPIQIHLLNGTQHRPHQMILRQPLHQRGRHQQQLTTVNRYEISSHPGSVLNRSDSTDNPTASRPSASPASGSASRSPGMASKRRRRESRRLDRLGNLCCSGTKPSVSATRMAGDQVAVGLHPQQASGDHARSCERTTISDGGSLGQGDYSFGAGALVSRALTQGCMRVVRCASDRAVRRRRLLWRHFDVIRSRSWRARAGSDRRPRAAARSCSARR